MKKLDRCCSSKTRCYRPWYRHFKLGSGYHIRQKVETNYKEIVDLNKKTETMALQIDQITKNMEKAAGKNYCYYPFEL